MEEVFPIQCLSVSAAQCNDIVAVVSNIASLVRAVARYRRVKARGPVDDAAPKPFGNKVDIDV